jgi:hypothetical protein
VRPLSLISLGLLCAQLVPGLALANSVWIKSVQHDCLVSSDTLEVDVMLENSSIPIDDGTLEVPVPRYGTFVGAVRGELVHGWDTFNVTAGPSNDLLIEVANSAPLPAGTSGRLARLLFTTTCCVENPSGHWLGESLCPQGRAGDFLAPMAMVCGYFNCDEVRNGRIQATSGFSYCNGGIDTVRVDIRLVDTPAPVNDGGFNAVFGETFHYVRWERGELTGTWENLSVDPQIGPVSTLAITGLGSVAIPAGTTGVFMTVVLEVHCCEPLGPSPFADVYITSPTGDLATFAVSTGNWQCMPVPTKPTTWGAIKAMYR